MQTRAGTGDSGHESRVGSGRATCFSNSDETSHCSSVESVFAEAALGFSKGSDSVRSDRSGANRVSRGSGNGGIGIDDSSGQVSMAAKTRRKKTYSTGVV